jgi:hypothetical protein
MDRQATENVLEVREGIDVEVLAGVGQREKHSRRLAVAAGQRLALPAEGTVLQALTEAEGADCEPAELVLSDSAPPELLQEGITLSATASSPGSPSST